MTAIYTFAGAYPNIKFIGCLILRGTSSFPIPDHSLAGCAQRSLCTWVILRSSLTTALPSWQTSNISSKPAHSEFTPSSAVQTSHDIKGNHMHAVPSFIQVLATSDVVAHHKVALEINRRAMR
ncbi:hypothetical protein BDK51DRAFT_31015 [Blyttiomyces helicus]|uniref:Uncharacterized protein n=1 Tax=Blyttiomyces helicus TaxID=388810 RepID=A0A4P9WRT2_9FUNG|nr:hypothetical protein BDK51DRAFT_31015 [Blyttiomyces helicus]|eukprot:RKO94618.1 hypothetical protein BDK51DRAFT_31015 [Blyttiomyces helicus]